METAREFIASGLQEIETDLADEFGATQKLTLPSGQQLPCSPSMEDVATEIAIGPQIESNVVVVRVRKALFKTADLQTITADTIVSLCDDDTPRLRSGKKPAFRTKTYRVLKVAEDATGAYFKIFLGSAR
jgi:hypothetical protein